MAPKAMARAVIAALLAVVWTGAALAADIALVIGNRDYREMPRVTGAEASVAAAEALAGRGFQVAAFRDLSAEAMPGAVARLVTGLETAERVVILLNGRFAHGAGESWFLPMDADAPGLAGLGAGGLPVSVLLGLAARKPGGAVVLLGTDDRAPDMGAGLRPGLGALDVPQGVLLVTGGPADLDRLLRDGLLRPGVTFAEALAEAPRGVRGAGFVSDLAALVPPSGAGPGPGLAELFEQAYWDAVLDLDTVAALEQYLDRYPDGIFAADARERIVDLQEEPEREARAVEEALGLDRDARRRVQQDLSLLGYDTRGIDGIFGRGTRSAIADWQDAGGLPVTGYLTRAQIARLADAADARAAALEAQAKERRREAERADRTFWDETGRGAGEAGLRRYLDRYPDGLYAETARDRLDQIEAERRARIPETERRAWDAARDRDTIAAYRDYLDRYPEGAFAEAARDRVRALERDREEAGRLDAARAGERALGLNPITRMLVETQLARMGHDPGQVDGSFDDRTRAAIRRYQRAQGLEVTGYLSRAVLVRMLAGMTRP